MSRDVTQLFEQHHAALFRYLVRLTGDADLAHDAAQEAFTRFIMKPPRSDQPKAWLFAVATNFVRASANSSRRRRQLLAAAQAKVPAGDPQAGPEETLLSDARRSAVRQALDALGERERMVLLMREEGFTHREIAAAVGTTTGSIGTMIARALDRLAAALPLDARHL